MLLRWAAGRAASALRGERAQSFIFLIGFITVLFVIAAIVIDFGIWMSERRGAQKDADAAALAATYQLLDQEFQSPAATDVAAAEASAQQAAIAWAARNDLPQADLRNFDAANASCLGPTAALDSVSLDAEHHTQAVFASIFGVVAPEIGAHARACLGSVTSRPRVLPVAVQSGIASDCWADLTGDGRAEPRFGQECELSLGADEQATAEAGAIRLYDDGSFRCSAANVSSRQAYERQISVGGADTTCYLLSGGETCQSQAGACVWPLLERINPQQEQRAFQRLLEDEGDCDAAFGDGNGRDDFSEVLAPATGNPSSAGAAHAARACESPRLVSLVVVQQFRRAGNLSMPVFGLAPFFITGCASDDADDSEQEAVCDGRGSGSARVRLHGYFVNLLESEGAVGPIETWSPKRVILTE